MLCDECQGLPVSGTPFGQSGFNAARTATKNRLDHGPFDEFAVEGPSFRETPPPSPAYGVGTLKKCPAVDLPTASLRTAKILENRLLAIFL
jgi:hypothetical protein